MKTTEIMERQKGARAFPSPKCDRAKMLKITYIMVQCVTTLCLCILVLWLLCCARKNQFKRCCVPKNPFAKVTNDRSSQAKANEYRERQRFPNTQNKPKQLPFISLLDGTIVPGEHTESCRTRSIQPFSSGFFFRTNYKQARIGQKESYWAMHTHTHRMFDAFHPSVSCMGMENCTNWRQTKPFMCARQFQIHWKKRLPKGNRNIKLNTIFWNGFSVRRKVHFR